MIKNPFLSGTFLSLWSKHFYGNKAGIDFEFITGPRFYKPNILPLYINMGKNVTKGISYSLVDSEIQDFKGKTFLLYDVPKSFNVDTKTHSKNLNIYKIRQYPGFLINLDSFTNLNQFMTSNFNKSSRYKLNKYKKRLEASFDITYTMFFGEIVKEEYDLLFEHFNKLLQKRFLDKQITNNNLDPKEWEFYHEVAYPMILEKKASLFVIYSDTTPIGVTLSYHSESILFDAITVFDIDYGKFHVGSITIMKLIEWCLENNLNVLDFSKGYFDYKARWANKRYDFEYHILYDSKSVKSSILASFIKIFFKLKQTLREKNINKRLHKLLFFIRRSELETSSDPITKYQFSGPIELPNLAKFNKIAFNEPHHAHLKPMVFDFLYLNSEKINDVTVYSLEEKPNSYLICGKVICQEVQVE